MEKAERVFKETLSELLAKVEAAKAEAPTNKQFDDRKRKETELVNEYIQGHITGDIFDARDSELHVQKGTLEFDNLPEYTRALKAVGFPPELLAEVLAHENAHMNRVEAHGLQGKYLLEFFKSPDAEGVEVRPAVNYVFPKEMQDDDEIRKILKDIIEAPDELSGYDKAQLGNS